MRQLQIIHGKSNEIWLNPLFRKALLQALSDPATLLEGQLFDSADVAEHHFQQKWNGVLYCVASGGQSHRRYTSVGTGIVSVLLNAGLLAKEQAQLSISNVGFQFLLADSAEQVATLLIHYLMELPAGDFVPVFSLLASLALLKPGAFYPMAGLSALEKKHLRAWSEYGLLLVTKMGGAAGFVPTKLVKAVSYTGERPLMLTKEEGFLIIETNYKFYAYTDSPLHLSILSLFMRVKTKFANMIFGQLTQDSVLDAYRKGITAAQISRFLASSAHPVMRAQKPVLPPTIVDQINLWEQDRNRLKAKSGYMYQQFMSAAAYEKTVAEANRLGAVLYANPAKRLLVVSETGHSQIKTFVKANL